MKRHLLLAALLGGLVVAAARAQTPAPAGNTVSEYILHSNDTITMHVYQEDDMDTTARVGEDGTVRLPLIGVVKVAGKTVEDATANIHDLLAADYLVNPQVTLTVVDYAKQRYTVLGEVQKPGTFEIPPGESVNLLGAIANAGGYTRIGSPRKITVQRNNGTNSQTFHLNAEDMAKNKNATPFVIQPNDTITIGQALL
jgi:polysaccharide export outer membrane protein